MNARAWFRTLGNVASALLVTVAVTVSAQAQSAVTVPTTAVGATSATQTVTVTITTAGIAASIKALTQGASGADYATVAGGTCALTTAYTVNQTCTVTFTFAPTRSWVRNGSITIADAAGNLLGNSFVSGVGTGPQAAYSLSSSTIPSVVLGSFTNPSGVAVDGSGNIYVADSGHNAVIKAIAVGGVVPSNPSTFTYTFAAPFAVAVDGAGNVYVTDSGNNQIKEMVAVGGVVSATPVIRTIGSGYSNPQGVAVDGQGNVYVADTGHNAVKEIAAVNGVIPAAATPTTLSTAFSLPSSVAVDANGNVYVADSGNSAVKEIVASGGVIPPTPTITALGTGFSNPLGVALDPSGDLYVADNGNVAVKEIVAAGGSVSASSPVVTVGTGFAGPKGVAADSNGNVFVADAGTVSGKLMELGAQVPPTLTFASTAVGVVSSDSPQTATVANIGNAPLIFSIPVAGNNPSIAADFNISNASTCPQVASGASSTSSLAAGASCTDVVNFKPTQAGSITGSLIATDNNLNAVGSTQSLPLAGTATPGTLTIAPASASAVVGSNAVILTAQVGYGGVTPIGAVTFVVNGGSPLTASCPVTPSPITCTATYDASALPVAGSPYAFTVNAAGNSNYNSASANGALTITKGTPVLTLGTGTPSTSVVNMSVSFTVSVTPNSGITPPSTVSFTTTVGGVTTPIAACAAVTVTAGQGTCTTSALTIGANTITASIVGDTNFFPATSNTVNQTVNKANTSVVISAPSPAVVDASVTFTATLSSPFGVTPIAPGGTVRFQANGTDIALCTAQPVSATTHAATCTTNSLSAPADTITALYSGDSSFNISTAPTVTQVLTKNAPTTSVSSSLPTTAVVNQAVTFTATVTPAGASAGGVLPTGSVTFANGATVLCGGPVGVTGNSANGTATATCATSFNGAGTSNIVATYSGDQSFTAGTAGNVQQIVLAAPTKTTVSSTPTTVGIGQSVSLTASIAPANSGSGYPGTAPLPNGTATFTDSTTGATLCSGVTVVAGSSAACSSSFTTLGSHTITASFTSSDPNFSNTTTSTGVAITVNTSTTTIGISGSPTLNVNQAGTFTASFNQFPLGLSSSPGTITYFEGSTALTGTNCANVPAPNPSVASGSTSVAVSTPCSYAFGVSGLHSIHAVFTPGAGGSAFSTLTSSNLLVSVGVTGTTVAFTSPTSTTSTTDQPITFTATVTATTTGSANPTGTVSFSYSNGGPSVALCQPATLSTSAGGVTSGSCTAPLQAAGTYVITALYSGDPNFSQNATTYTQIVGKTATSLAVTLPTSPTINVPSTYAATVSTGSVVDTGLTVPSGTVTFTDTTNPAVTCIGNVAASGVASCSLTPITAGTSPHTISVTYSGDNNFGAFMVSPTETVAKGTPSISAITSSSLISVATQMVTFTATVTGTAPTSAPTVTSGSFSFTVGTGGIYSCPATVAPGANSFTATCTVFFPTTASGSIPVTATYNGDNNYFSTSTGFIQTVQNFTLSATPSSLRISQGSTNLGDVFVASQPIALTVALGSSLPDTLLGTCTIAAVAPTTGTTGVTCVTTGPAGLTGATVSASSTATPGTYNVQYVVTDTNTNVPSLSHSVTVPLTVVNLPAGVSVASVGAVTASFTAPSSLTSLSCDSRVEVVGSSPVTYTTLSTIGLQCSSITATTATPTAYTFTITAGSGTIAKLEPGNGGITLAYLGAPFLLLLGFLPSTKKYRKALLRSVAILVLSTLALYASGCSSGGFDRGQTVATRAVDGTYLLNITSGGVTVAEVTVVVHD